MKWLYGLIGLVLLIVFHEFGHFIAAKIFGVKVESFSVGFGPVLLHKKFGDTDFRLSLIPLGGYCGMKGEKDFQKALENNQAEINGDSDSLYGVSPIKRAFIGFAGPFINLILAVISFSIIAGVGYKYYSYSNQIILANELYENSSMAAENAGIKTGDKIIKINNEKVEDFSQIISEISTKADEDIKITVDRNGEILEFTVHSELDKESGIGKIGIAADTNSLLEKEAERYSFFPAIGQGFKECFEYTKLTFKSIGVLFKGVNIANTVSGPVRVTNLLGATIEESFKADFRNGLVSILSLMGLISLSLGIMNLLPIPILDGGLILLALIEAITRKKIKPKIQYYIQFIGLAFILFLFIIGCVGDISYFIHK
ncbi:MAG: RIP metalloprotease RseP [Treponema sp.]|nr:RIP metalloprotease RseP [Treponema sp.]